MDIGIAAGGPIMVRGLPALPGKKGKAGKAGATRDVLFGRLTMADLAELQAHVPGDARFVTIFELGRFAGTLHGADQVLLLSLRRLEPATSIEDVKQLGSILQRVEISRVVMGDCMTTGEDGVLTEEARQAGGGSGGKAAGQGTGPTNQS